MSVVVWLVPIALPLALAGVAFLAGRAPAAGWLLPVAALPALGLGLGGAPAPPPDLTWVLFGATLDLDPLGRVLLVLTAGLWVAGGWYAATAMADHPHRAGFTALSLLTMAGNLGLLLAADVVTFYLCFSVMTFSAYGLVVTDRSAFALRAGRVYVVLAAGGEALLLAALILGVSEAGGRGFDTFAAGVAESPATGLLTGLLVGGFAVKAGILPVHVWLPLAHPAAPVPASALLSGAMIKAGLVGWLRMLPAGAVPLPGWGVALLAAGLASAFVGVALGFAQRDAKVLLAYSSVSQMGMMAVLVGAALVEPDAASLAYAAAAAYALHHGLAKGALFLGVGIAKGESGPRRHRIVLGGIGLAAASLAGLPLTSGALAKAALKDALGILAQPWAATLTLTLSLAAAGTTVLMARLFALTAHPARHGHAPAALLAPWAALLVAVAAATWVLPAALFDDLGPPPLSPTALWEGSWPVVLGLTASAALWWWGRARGRGVPAVPPGDALGPVEAGLRALGALASGGLAALEARLQSMARRLRDGALGRVPRSRTLVVAEGWLARWRVVVALFIALGAALVASLMWAGP